jgi:hypothetical protein
MAAVQLQEFAFHKLCGVIVTGNADSLSRGADGFKN